MLDGKHATAFLATAGSARDSSMLNGLLSTAFLATGGSAGDSYLHQGVTVAQIVASGGGGGDFYKDGHIALTGELSGTGAYFSADLSATNIYGTVQGTIAVATSASNADKLDGYHSTAFLATAGSARDSSLFAGYATAAFILTGGTATSASDSDKLDGLHAASFAFATVYGTGSAPAASGYSDGTLWVKYTA